MSIYVERPGARHRAGITTAELQQLVTSQVATLSVADMSTHMQTTSEYLYTGKTVAELQPLITSVLAAITVADIKSLKNTHIILDPSPDIDHRIEERSTANFEVWDEEMHHHFEYGQEVLIRDDQGRLFGGLIEEPSYQVINPEEGGYLHSISCIDYQALADRRQFYHAYESETGGNIVRDILDILAEEGVIEGEIQPGKVLEMITFNGISCAESMDKVCELCGYTWIIDEFKRLYFIERTTYPADWNIQDGSELLAESVIVTDGNPEYRNVQYVQGGQAETSELSESFRGDGTQKSFTVGYPLARVPTIEVNGEPKTMGIKGVDVDYDWYWNKGDATVTQDQAATPLAGGETPDILTITYVGTFKLMTKASQAAEITRQKLVQGFGSGKIEKTLKDSSLQSQDSALAAAKAKLLHYATIGRKLQYDTRTPGLAAGVLQNVTIPFLGIDSSDMLLVGVRVSFPEGDTTYTVEACEGPVEDSWQKLFCGIADEMRRQSADQVGVAETVQGLEEFSKTWLSSEHPNPFLKVYAGCTPADIDFPCLADEDRLTYVVLYSSGMEFFRKPVTLQSNSDDDTEIYTTCIILAQEANGIPMDFVALWGGNNCSSIAGSGIELQKHSYSKTKNSLESIQLDFVSIKNW